MTQGQVPVVKKDLCVLSVVVDALTMRVLLYMFSLTSCRGQVETGDSQSGYADQRPAAGMVLGSSVSFRSTRGVQGCVRVCHEVRFRVQADLRAQQTVLLEYLPWAFVESLLGVARKFELVAAAYSHAMCSNMLPTS
eukprot:5197323-Amphidinium_carterae.1